MEAVTSNEQDRTRASLISLIFHAALFLVLVFYTWPLNKEEEQLQEQIVIEWGGGGDNAAAGLPDEGMGDNPAPQGQQMEDPSVTEEAENPAASTPVPAQPSAPPAASAPAKSNTPTTEDPNVAALRKQQEEAKRKNDEQERVRRAQDAERQRVADEQRRQQQEAADRAKKEQAERDAKKGKFGGSFGKPGASGTGQGNTNKPGNQGIPGGTGTNPNGKSNGDGGGSGGGSGTGVGMSHGGGLSGREPLRRIKPDNNFSKSGTIRVEICVDAGGSVVSANAVQKGSTSFDSDLRNKAVSAAKQWKFKPSNGADRECGWVDFYFRFQ